MITFDEFKKVEIRAGKIISAEKIPETDKLLKLMVDFGEFEEVKSVGTATASATGSEKVSTTQSATVSATVSTSTTLESAADTAIATKDGAKTEAITLTPKIPKIRQIVSGIALKFPDTASLVGKTCMFVTNLEPRMIKGHESNGMLFAVSTSEGGFSLLEPNATIPPGTMAI